MSTFWWDFGSHFQEKGKRFRSRENSMVDISAAIASTGNEGTVQEPSPRHMSFGGQSFGSDLPKPVNGSDLT